MDEDKAVARLEALVRDALEACGLAGGARLVVAVSGGPDSLAMLYALSRLRGELDLDLYGAHLDHGLRGEASDSDSRFVAETFDRLGIPSTIERADVPSFQKRHRLSPEEAAREVRFAFLARLVQERSAHAAAVGHTSDDQAETVLMHIVRGAGVTGLRGMQLLARRKAGGREVSVVRPLLRSSRNETAAYCRALQLAPRLDESNLSTVFTRNRVRLELLPLLQQFNPNVRDALLRLSSNAQMEVEYLDSVVGGLWDEAVRQAPRHVALNRRLLSGLVPAIRTHLLRRAIACLEGGLGGFEQKHIDEMVRLAAGPAGRAVDLPGGLRFMVGYEEVAVASRGANDDDLCPLPPLNGEHPLSVPGDTTAGRWRISIAVVERNPGTATRPPANAGHARFPEFARGTSDAAAELTAELGLEALEGTTLLRRRRPADRFQPLGMAGSKSLQDFMVDAKVPRWCRDRVPLVVSKNGIACVVGWRVADWARVRETDARRLELRFAPEPAP